MRTLLQDTQHEYSESEVNALVAVNVFGATLSLLGSLFIVINYCSFESLRKIFAYKLVLMIGISDGILAISNLMGAPDKGALCNIQALLQEVGDISGILWVASVSWSINKVTQLTISPAPHELKALYLKMHAVIWSITAVMTILPFTTNSYGVAGGWCWIKGEDQIDTVWRYVCFYGPLWIAIIYMIVIYAKVFKRLRMVDHLEPDDEDYDDDDNVLIAPDHASAVETTTAGIDEAGGLSSSMISSGSAHRSSQEVEEKFKRKQNNTLQRMKFYPMILIFCYTFATIRRFMDWATEDQTPYALAILHTWFAAIPGFLNAIVYGFTKDVQQRDRQALQQHCGVCLGDKASGHRVVSQNAFGAEEDSDDQGL